MKRILTLCVCILVCAPDCHADVAAEAVSDTDDASVDATPNSASSVDGRAKPVCMSDVRHGKNPQTDECVECPVGKFFNANDSAHGYCSTAIALSKSDLKYGYKSRTEKSRVSHQCWTKKNPSEYRACVKYGMPVYVGDIQTNVANVLTDPATK